MVSELSEIGNQFKVTRTKYREYLPKVDPALIDYLVLRQMENSNAMPMYMVEVFLEPGIDGEMVRQTVIPETGAAPAIYDRGTHVAAHHRLTLEMLENISSKDGGVEITGAYSGDFGNWAPSHERRSH